MSKYWKFEESRMVVLDTKSKTHPNTAPFLLLFYTITNEKAVKLTQTDRIPAISKTFPAETHSNISSIYTLLSLIYFA